MLVDVLGVVIPRRKILLQIMLDVMLDAKSVNNFQNAMGVTLPIGIVGHREVVSPPDLVEVHIFVRGLNDGDAAVSVKCRLQTDPRKDAGVVKGSQRGDAVNRQRCATFPLSAKSSVETGERRGKRITLRAEKVKERKRTGAAFGQRAERQPAILQSFNGRAGQADIKRVEGVSREGKHHLLGDAASRILAGILAERIHEKGSGRGVTVKLWPPHAENLWHIAVGAGVPAPTVRISGELCILSSLPTGSVDVRTSCNAPTVRVYLVTANLGCHGQFPFLVAGG